MTSPASDWEVADYITVLMSTDSVCSLLFATFPANVDKIPVLELRIMFIL